MRLHTPRTPRLRLTCPLMQGRQGRDTPAMARHPKHEKNDRCEAAIFLRLFKGFPKWAALKAYAFSN